jgi:hypothetical protein
VDDGLWPVYRGGLLLGRFHERLLRIEDAQGDLPQTRRGIEPIFPFSNAIIFVSSRWYSAA